METSLLDTGALWLEADFVADSHALFAHLAATVAWDERMRARKSASFGLPYNYSGITYPAAPFPDVLLPLLDRLDRRLGYRPNNCLANYYPDGTSTMGFHFDATEELVPGTGIAIISLGAERTLTFRSQADRNRLEHYALKSGSLLYMTPEMQAHWKHGLLAQDSAGGRISLTFRCLNSA
jgi:alkylated DNA repair dioxygenase AlkB